MLYIVLFLHQTTTNLGIKFAQEGCISYYSYIKPQQFRCRGCWRLRCISYYSYIKPQLPSAFTYLGEVVYRTIPTSNHNLRLVLVLVFLLYIVLFLHQTTTWALFSIMNWELYIVLFLHQTTTVSLSRLLTFALYIVLFLHQTTTTIRIYISWWSCISYYSYIKPQLVEIAFYFWYCCISYYSYIKPQRLFCSS